MHSPSAPWSRAILLAGAAAIAGALGACGGDEPAAPARSASTVAARPAPVPTAPAPLPAPKPVLNPLDWRSAQHPGQPVGLVRTRGGFFGLETRAVARLTLAGKVRWRYRGPATDDFGGFVAGGIPFAVPATGPEPKRGYRPHAVKALDPRTGQVLWSRPATHYATTDGSRVYAPTCTGAQTGRVGECTLTAYAPRTGAVRWTRPLTANLQRIQFGAGVMVVQTFPRGKGPRFTVLDPATGAVRAALDLPEGRFLNLVGRHLVDAGPDDAKARGGCHARVTSYGLDGTVAWRRSLPLRRQRYERGRCDGYGLVLPAGGGIALSSLSSPALVLDAATGRTRYAGPRGAKVLGLAAGRLVVEDEDRTRTLGVDPASGRTRWTYRGQTGGWSLQDGYLASNRTCGDPGQCGVVLDARTGRRLLTVPGVPEGHVAPAGRGGRPGLLLRLDAAKGYTARYGFVTLPPR